MLQNQVEGEPFKVSDGFYGTGETFVFTFCPEFEVRTVIPVIFSL